MHSRLQQYSEMFFMHSRAFVGESSHLRPNSLTLWARDVQTGLPPFSVHTRQTIITIYAIIIPTANLILLH